MGEIEKQELRNLFKGLPWQSSGKESAFPCSRCRFDPWSGKENSMDPRATKPVGHNCWAWAFWSLCPTTREAWMLQWRAQDPAEQPKKIFLIKKRNLFKIIMARKCWGHYIGILYIMQYYINCIYNTYGIVHRLPISKPPSPMLYCH